MHTTQQKFEETAIIIKQEEIADDIYSMWLHTEQIAAHAKAGQFVSVYCKEGSRLLPRPISICEIDRKDGALRLVYRVAGKGTEEFSSMHTGMQLKVIGPLGNGFPKQEKKAFLIGGGIGIPPMLELAKELNCEKQIVLGYRDELFLLDEFRKQGEVYIATEDGSVGLLTDTGYVTEEAGDILPGVDLAVLEANHDVETLCSGSYPYYLKQRILGAAGHLCNEDAARFAVTLAESGASEIILAHLSRENNTPAMARRAVETALSAAGLEPILSVAPRDTLGPAHTVCRRAVCRE